MKDFITARERIKKIRALGFCWLRRTFYKLAKKPAGV